MTQSIEGDPWSLNTNQTIPDLTEVLPKMPDQLRRFILKACKRAPGQRYQSMLEMIKALKPMAEQFGVFQHALNKPSRKMVTMVLLYEDSYKATLNKEMAGFCSRMQALGVQCKTAEFSDI